MNTIAIVGHPASGYEDVLALLQQSGMAAARPSRREGLSPQEINAALMTAHKVAPVTAVLDESGFTPIETGPVWHGMALDLMLGNLDEPLWGWADSQAIYALDYWKELDPQLTFVLVYDEPHRVLMDATRVHGQLPSTQNVHRLLDNWIAFNSALLRFHLRHPGRSLLVHAQQARFAAGTYLQQLQPLLGVQLSLPADSQAAGDTAFSLPASAPQLPAVLSQAVASVGAESQQAAALLAAAERYIVDGILANDHRALQRYAELQSAASLPLNRQAIATGGAAAAWETLVAHRNFVAELLTQIHAKYRATSEELSQARTRLDEVRAAQARESELLSNELRQLQQSLGSEKASIAQQKKDLEKASGEYKKNLQDLGEENQLLLTQLLQVQEALEKIQLRNQELEQRDTRNAARNKATAKRSRTRIKSLIQRLKNADQRLKSDRANEAERVKQEIPYRLGQVLIRHGRRPWGWPILPIALLREVRAHRRKRQGGIR